MTLARALRLAVHVQLAASALALITAGRDTFASGIVMLVFTGIAWISGGQWPRNPKNRKRFWNVLALGMLVAFVIELTVSGDLLAPVVRLVVFLCIYKLFTISANRDYITLLLLSFLQMLAATSISYESVYIIPYVIYVISSGFTLILHTRKTGMEREQMSRNIITGFPRHADLEGVKARKLWIALGLCAATLLLTAMIFPLFPRMRTNVMAPGDNTPVRALSGFSQSVSLEAMSDIQTSPAVIMRVTLSGDRNRLPRLPKLRGIVLTRFDGLNWQNVFLSGQAIRTEESELFQLNDVDSPLTLEQDIFLNPINSRALFTTGVPQIARGPFHVLYLDRMNTLFKGRRHFQQIRYVTRSAMFVRGNRIAYDLNPPAAQHLQQLYLQLPQNRIFTRQDRFQLRQLALDITRDAETDLERARAIERYLSTTFQYSLELSQYRNARNKMISFLFDGQSGHCEYFASAMTLLCRSINIPARMVNGFQLGQLNPVGNFYTVRAADAHSWVEVYLPGQGWLEFDPTPVGGQQSDFASETPDFLKSLFDSADLFWTQYVLAFDALDQQAVFNAVREAVTSFLSVFAAASDWLLSLIPDFAFTGQLYSITRWIIAVVLFSLFLFFFYRFILLPIRQFISGKMRRRRSSIVFFRQLLALLRKQGIELAPHETARALKTKPSLKEHAPEIAAVVEAYEIARFSLDDQEQSNAAARGQKALQNLRRKLNNT